MNPDKLAAYLDEAFQFLVRASQCHFRGDIYGEVTCLSCVEDQLLKAKVWAEQFKLQRVTFK